MITSKTRNILKIITFSVILAVVVIFGTWVSKYVMTLTETEAQAKFLESIESFGIWGWLILLLVQILQIIIAFIPGEPIELIAGLLYGTYLGLGICLVGILIGSFITFNLTRKFGRKVLDIFFEHRDIEKFEFMQNERKLKRITFILFLIPGTPKDILTYFAGLTDIPLKTFLIISTFARIPSVITSTMIGSSVMEGNYLQSVVIFGVTILLASVGALINNKIINKNKK